MKNLKRKIARLFGLALRSDLKKVNEAYKKRDKEAAEALKLLYENSSQLGLRRSFELGEVIRANRSKPTMDETV